MDIQTVGLARGPVSLKPRGSNDTSGPGFHEHEPPGRGWPETSHRNDYASNTNTLKCVFNSWKSKLFVNQIKTTSGPTRKKRNP